MQNELEALKEILQEIYALNGVVALLGWDQQTYMPEQGAEDRGLQIEAISRMIHQKSTSDKLAKLLADLQPYTAQLDPTSDDACLIRKATRQMEKQKKVPVKWVAEFARITTLAQSAWEKAREGSDFSAFQPFLEQIVEKRREYASFFAPYDHIYDPQLDDFEEGMKTADVMDVFNGLRSKQVELVQRISQCRQVEDGFLHQTFDEQNQWDFGVEVMSAIGFDWKRGRQDRTAHPFTNTIGFDDVRITTRFLTNYMPSSFFSSVHEMGHALYEMGFKRSLGRTLLATGASMAVHESQSRLWENLVGRSLSFWTHFYPRLQSYYPSQLKNVSMKQFYQGINQVKPSLIRVEADEATYNLHIMLRLELEIQMLEGKVRVCDIPEAWNASMKAYLGLTPPDDARGVLQDVHWAFGGIGYFPTYTLGNVISAQIWETVHRDLPDLDGQIEQGKFDSLLAWLRENIHQHGAKYEPQDLVQRVTGSKINPQPYLNYLENKFKQIYPLD